MKIRLAGLAGMAGVLAATVFATSAGATFAGGNGPIVFSSDRNGNAEVFRMANTGTGQTNLTNNAANDFDPNWSQDRSKIVFVSDRDGNSEIYVMNADGTGQTRVTNSAAGDTDPAFSPDNTKIVFASDRDGDREIYTVPVEGGSVTKLTNNGVQDFAPDWSSDGAKIAFQRFTGGVGPGTGDEIFAMNADGTGQTNLTNNAGTISDRNPSWKSDGTRIAFESNRDGDFEIFRMSSNGSNQTQLTNSSAADVQPAYSPDGTKIAFSSNRSGNAEVFTMAESGASQTNISNSTGADAAPSWQALDIFPPDTSITAGPAADSTINDPSPDFEFTSTEAGSTFECSIDGGPFASCPTPYTVTPDLADGSHTFAVRAIDPSGNVDPTPATRTFSTDTTIDTQFTAGPADGAPTNDTTPTYEFTANEPATFECQVDGGGFAACESPYTTAELADGPHTIEVRATDTVGNTDATPALRTVTVDTGAPETTIDTGPAEGGLTNTATPTFTFSSDEPGTFECSVDGAPFASCSTPFTTDPLADGEHTFAVRAIDAGNNTDPTPAQRTFTVDTTFPETTIDAGPSDPTDDRTPTFEFSSDDPGATFECSVDGGAYDDCASPFTTDELDDGSHTFSVRATDAAGNTDASPAEQTFSVDAPPRTSIDTGVAEGGFTNDTTPEFTFSSDEDPDATFECSVDGGPYSACTSPFSTDPLSDGTHTFSVRALDLASRPDPSPPTRTFTVDTDAPETSFTAGPADGAPTNDTTPTYEFESDEPGGTFECSVDGGAFDLCTSPFTTPGLAEGSHTVAVRAIDQAGNADASPAERTVVIDLTAPETQWDFGPADGSFINDPTPTFGFSSPTPGDVDHFECSLDGGPFAPCESGVTTDELADGPHTYSVRAVDSAGNPDPTPSEKSFTVDTIEPETTIDAGVADGGITNDATPTFEFSSNEAGATFMCAVDADPFAPCTSPYTTSTLSDGSHIFRVQAVDQAGNVDQSLPTRNFTVDTAEPETTIDSGPVEASTIADRTPTFEFSSSEASSTFECSVDGGAFDDCTSPFTTTDLADGPHSFAVRATDAAGNTDSSPAERTFTVDGAPDTQIDNGPAGGARINDPSPEFQFSSPDDVNATFECDVDGGGYQPCTSPYTVSPDLSEGDHTFSVRAVDTSNQADDTPASRTFTVDLTAPVVQFDSGPSDPTNETSATFTFSSNEPGTTFTCSLDSGPADPCTSGFSQAALAEGPHDLELVGTDEAGNQSTPVIYDWVIDLTEPETTIDAGPVEASTVDDRTPTFEFSSDDPAATFECSVDGGSYEACTSPLDLDELDDGPHTFAVRATDEAGNTDSTPAERSFTVDAAPRTQITAGPAGGSSINDPSPTFEFTSDEDPDSTFECDVDGGGFQACTSPFTVSPDLGEGSHTVTVRALDASLRPDPTPPSRTFTVDLTEPTTSIDTGPADGSTTGDDTPTFEFSSNDPDATFECSVNGGAYADCDSPFTTSSLTDGSNTFAVRATDEAGNTDSTPAERTFTVDTTAPDTNVTSGPADGGTTGDNTPTFEFNSPDGTATFECNVDGAGFNSCTSPFTIATLSEGSHTVAIRAVDPSNNADATPVSRTFTVDTGAPSVTIDSGPGAGTTTADNTPTFGFSSEAGASFKCSVDVAVPTASCTSPFTAATLTDGAHTFRVSATDAGGNTTTVSRAFTVDTTAPNTNITNGPAEGSSTTDTTPTFEFTSTEGGSTFQCAVDAGAFQSCTSPATTAALSVGAHTFRVRAADAVGNQDATPATRSFTVAAPPNPQVIRLATGKGGKVKAKKGRIAVTLTCPADATEPCTGTISLGGGGKGSVPFTIAPGQSAKFAIKLSKAAKAKLGRSGSAKLTLTITGSDGQTAKLKYTAKAGKTGSAKK